jgi:hypothetical protein
MNKVAAVGRLALEDKAFFEELLKSPGQALRGKVEEGVLNLTEEEILEIVERLEVGYGQMVAQGRTMDDLMRAWAAEETHTEWTPDWPSDPAG